MFPLLAHNVPKPFETVHDVNPSFGSFPCHPFLLVCPIISTNPSIKSQFHIISSHIIIVPHQWHVTLMPCYQCTTSTYVNKFHITIAPHHFIPCHQCTTLTPCCPIPCHQLHHNNTTSPNYMSLVHITNVPHQHHVTNVSNYHHISDPLVFCDTCHISAT
jgi:hypothetical protein